MEKQVLDACVSEGSRDQQHDDDEETAGELRLRPETDDPADLRDNQADNGGDDEGHASVLLATRQSRGTGLTRTGCGPCTH